MAINIPGDNHGRVAIDPNAVTTSSLQALQSDDQRKVMDIVDRLRRTGLSGVVELPQLIVCGDQSSGKSSVLEAITEIPFPHKENLYTRFATEIILRRSTASTSTITITPDKLRPISEQAKLKAFTKFITDFDQLPEVIEEATLAMELGAIGSVNSRAFSRDVLSIEITGPNRPQLTLVDLPGLIHATNKAQTETDKELILDLVHQDMKNPRTIILAVVSAKNDYANQIYPFDPMKSSQEALDTQRAYYKDEMKYFVTAVTKAVIERHLVEPLPDLVLSPLVVTEMAEQEIAFVAAEPAKVTQQCAYLDNKKSMLEKGLETFREAMGGLKR